MLAMAFHKGDDELRTSFNRFLASIKQNGVYDDMSTRWTKTGNHEMPVIPESKPATGTLVVGMVHDMGFPFITVQNNRLVGFNVEMLDRFGVFVGRKIEYVSLDFGSLIAALESRKIDMIGSVISITPERAKSVDFSDPYYEEQAKVFALKKNIAGAIPETDKKSDGNILTRFLSGTAESFQSNIIQENRWRLIVRGLWVTVVISFLSTLFGTVLGGAVCFLRMSNNVFFRSFARAYISVMRGTPVLVVLMLIFYVVFASVNIDPVVVAVFAFGMNFAAYAAEIYRAGIEGIDRGQREAGIAMGFSRTETFRHIIIPQTVMRILPVYKGEFISLVKMTSIVGYIAVQDLTKASDIIRSRTFDAFFPIIMVAVLYYFISWTLLLFIGYLEKTINPRFKRRTVPQQA
ncbi:MAG: ABC transporter substrate-binding protein/permease [Chlorobiaceae bacterium]|nr:ABC transporter substrate-binding protein/permease [Chlorobiaceae bacterium]